MRYAIHMAHRIRSGLGHFRRSGGRKVTLLGMAAGLLLSFLHEFIHDVLFPESPEWLGRLTSAGMAMLVGGIGGYFMLLLLRRLAQQRDDEAAARDRLSYELTEERNLVRAMMESSEDLIYFKDRESRFLRINGSLARHFGLASPADAVGKTDRDMFPPELAAQKRQDELRVMETGQAIHAKDEQATGLDGSVRWVTTSKMPLRDRQGAIVGTFGISRDITSRKLAEERRDVVSGGLQNVIAMTDELIACEEEETLFRRAVELARTGLGLDRCSIFIDDGEFVKGTFGTNLNGETTDERGHRLPREGKWVDRLRLRTSGEKRWDVSDETYHEWSADAVAPAGRGAVATTPIQSSQHEVIGVFCNDNAISGRPLDPARQEVVVVFCTLLGTIVARKRAERERQATEVRQRTLLERTDRLNALGMLAAGMAHEINNPLQGMLSHVRALQPFVPPESSGRRSLDMVQKGVDTIAALVRRLLMMGASDESGRDGTDVFEAVEFVTQLVEAQFRRVNVSIQRNVTSRNLRVVMPRAEFMQVLMNLLINARDAMPTGGIIRVAAEADGQAVRISVADTGLGIPPEIRKDIFAPFFTTKGSKGTGLGLCVTDSLVRANHGTISVVSEVGSGAEFIVSLPMPHGKST